MTETTKACKSRASETTRAPKLPNVTQDDLRLRNHWPESERCANTAAINAEHGLTHWNMYLAKVAAAFVVALLVVLLTAFFAPVTPAFAAQASSAHWPTVANLTDDELATIVYVNEMDDETRYAYGDAGLLPSAPVGFVYAEDHTLVVDHECFDIISYDGGKTAYVESKDLPECGV